MSDGTLVVSLFCPQCDELRLCEYCNCKKFKVFCNKYNNETNIFAMDHEDAAASWAMNFKLMNQTVTVDVQDNHGVTKEIAVSAYTDIHYSTNEVER